jgi:hypothetical protein
MYPLLALLVLLTFERLDALIANDERRAAPWLAVGILVLVATWTHFLGYILVVATLAAAAWWAIGERRSVSAWSRFRPALLAALVPIAGVLVPLARALRSGPGVEGAAQARVDSPDAAEAARFVIEQATHLWPIGPLAPLLAVGGLIGLAVLARRSAALAVAVVTTAAVTLVAVIVGAVERPFGVDRYLLPWRLAVAIGLASLALLPGRWSRGVVTAVAVLTCLAGAWAAVPRGLPGPFAVGELARSLALGIDAGESVAFAPEYYEHLGRWYGLPVGRPRDLFPRRPDGSLPDRAWIFTSSSRNDAARAPGMGADRGRFWGPPDRRGELLDALEKAYGARADRAAIEKALRAHGAAAIAFTPGSATLHVPGETSPDDPRTARTGRS